MQPDTQENHTGKKETPTWIRNMELRESIHFFSNLYVQKTVKGAFCSAQEIDVLFRLELKKEPLSPVELSRLMNVSKPFISRLVESLVKKGLIEKEAAKTDRRSYLISLTPEGTRTLALAYNYYVEPLKKLEEKLGTRQFLQLMQLIELANSGEH